MPAERKPRHSILRVARYLLRHCWLCGLTLALALGSTFFLLAIPDQIQRILEQVQDEAAVAVLFRGILIIVALYLLRDLLNCLRIRANNTLEQRVLLEVREDLHAKLLRLSARFFDTRKSGEISSRVIEDVANVERALLDGTERGAVALFTLFGIGAVLFYKNPFLACFVLSPVPVLIAWGYFHARSARRRWREVRHAAGELNSLLVEDIQANRLIHSFGLRERERRRFRGRAKALEGASLRAMFSWSIYGPGTNFLVSLGPVMVIGVGGWLILKQPQQFGFPELFAFFLYASMLSEPLRTLKEINHLFSTGAASGERVFEILDHPEDIQDPAIAQTAPLEIPEVRFENVGFAYGGRAPVLTNFNFTLKRGRITALVGETGAGKTTIARLILRAYDATSGRITLNGVDIRALTQADLNARMGFVAQDPFLFEGTVADNLRLGSALADEDRLWAALRAACAEDFVRRLPQGLDTPVGERGVRLSQGEKQRITIARMLLKDPPMLLLDEATASVDTLTERQIQTALERLMKGRTVLIVAHRLSTVRRADAIVVIERGQIVETGTHESLLKHNGRYTRLWAGQADLIESFPQKI